MRWLAIALSVSISISISDSYGNSNGYGYGYSYSYSNSYGNGNGNSDSNGNSYSCSDGVVHSSGSFQYYNTKGDDVVVASAGVHGLQSRFYSSLATVYGPRSTDQEPMAFGLQPMAYGSLLTTQPDTTKPDSTQQHPALRDTVKVKSGVQGDVALRDTLSPSDTVKNPVALRDTVLPANCHCAETAEERAVYVRVEGLKKPEEKVVQFSIGRDTLYDLVALKDTNWHLIKHWPLMKGDTFCAALIDSSLSARWSFRSEGVEPVVQNEDLREFTGDIWYYKDVALLRINKTRDYPEKMNIVIGLQPGFDLDRLYLNVKLIHPTAGVKEVEKEVRVSEADELGKHDRLLRVYIPEWTLTDKGKYFLRIGHQHLSDRLNGIDFVSYELLTP